VADWDEDSPKLRENLAGVLVGNRTVPSVQVRIETLAVEGKTIAKISVPKVNQVVATTAGSYFKRRLKHDGSPKACPSSRTTFPQG
jgi:ATP-dependent DNA helicase RecG